MASINYATREISCKIVYYGPGLSGKTTNLQIIHRKIPDKDKSEMVSLATETDRTLFFDFLPLDLGSIKGFSTKFQLYTVPGQVYYNATRKLVLRGVDGVVFVVDSQTDKLQENLESFANLQENLREYGHSIENIPLVLQYNKRDLPNVYPVEQLNALINKNNLAYYEAVAATGVGVFTTLKAIGKAVIDKFNAKYAGFQGTRRPASGSAPAAPKPATPPAPAAPAPTLNPGAFGQGPKTPAGPQAFAGAFGNPPPAAPRPNAPAPGFGAPGNPFGGPAIPSSAGFPGPLPSSPKPQPASPGPGGFGAPPHPFGAPGPNPPAFGAGSPHPFAGNPPAAPQPSAFPGAPMGGPAGGAAGGFPAFPGPQAPGGIPQPTGTAGFQPPQGIPVSPFVDSFAKPATQAPGSPAPGGFGAPPAGPLPGAGAPPGLNPFNMPAKPLQPMPGFGSPPAPGAAPMGGGFPSAFPSSPGAQNPLQGGPGAGPGFASPGGFGAPAAGGFGGPLSPMNPPAGGGSGSPFQAPPVLSPKSAPPFPTLDPPAPPAAPKLDAPPEDTSGIVTTFEDLQKDDSFKTKKLPHPGEKKKGFFDGLFRKDK